MTALILTAVLTWGGWCAAGSLPSPTQQEKPPARPEKPPSKPPINPDETGGPRRTTPAAAASADTSGYAYGGPRGAVMLRGTVVDSAGKELPEVKVTVVAAADPKQRWETRTDAGGRFQLPDLPAGLFTLELSRPGYRTGRHLGLKLDSLLCSVRVAMQTGEPNRVVTERFAELRGRVRDAAGDPVAEAQVELRGGNFVRGLSLLTDAEGEFQVANIQSGDYTMQVAAPGFQTTERPLPVRPEGASRSVTVNIELRRN
jgi:hypothetical protein